MRQYLKELRKSNKLTQTQVAELIGVKANYYCMVENGERQQDMAVSLVDRLAKAFNVPIEYIVHEEQKLIN